MVDVKNLVENSLPVELVRLVGQYLVYYLALLVAGELRGPLVEPVALHDATELLLVVQSQDLHLVELLPILAGDLQLL